MENFQVGDVVEVVETRSTDEFMGIKLGEHYVVKKAYMSDVTILPNKDSSFKHPQDLWNDQLKLVSRGGK